MKGDKKITLTEKELPTHWYNIVADMTNKPLPPLNPVTKQAASKEDFLPIFAEELVNQEFSQERFIEIPEQVQDLYKIWRPTPLVRAYGLEKALDTPARIYFKNESTSMAGSHKPNTAIPQAYYNYKQGIKRLTTETGGGQWGSALSFAARYFGIDLKVFMVKVSYNQKPYRKLMMNTWVMIPGLVPPLCCLRCTEPYYSTSVKNFMAKTLYFLKQSVIIQQVALTWCFTCVLHLL